MEFIYTRKEKNMMVSGRMTVSMGKGKWGGKIILGIVVGGLTIRYQDWVYLNGQMAENTLGNGWSIRCMGMVFSWLKIRVGTKVSFVRGRDRGLECMFGLMGGGLKGGGKMASSMGWELVWMKGNRRWKWGCGTKERGWDTLTESKLWGLKKELSTFPLSSQAFQSFLGPLIARKTLIRR